MPEWQPRNTVRARELRREATPAERHLWPYLRGSQLGGHKFSRQMPLGPYFCDFLCRRAKMVIEVDGDTHAASREADARRDRFMQEQGYRVLRFSNADVLRNIEGVVTVIGEALADGPPPNPSCKREGSI